MQRGWRGIALAMVATAVLAGSASAQRGFGFGRGGGASMLRMPEVQTELKLTEDQKTKVTTFMERLQEEQREQRQGLRDLSQEERQKRMSEWRAAEDKEVAAILTADQLKRYRQLSLQRQGMSALTEKSVAADLKLTSEQQTKIQTILEEQQTEMRAFIQGGGGDFEAIRPKMEAARKKSDEKLAAVLTEDQKKQWKEMIGAPFTFPAFPGGRRLGA